MSTSSRAIPGPPSGAGLLLLVAALVVGVLGMHALSTACGGMSDGSGSGSGTAAVSSPTMHQMADDVLAETMRDDGDEGSPVDGAMSICMAVLLAVGSLLLALALRRSVRGWRVGRVRTPRTPCLAATARPRPPPSLARLSILRC